MATNYTKSAIKWFRILLSNVFPEPGTRSYIRHNRGTWKHSRTPGSRSEILVELYPVAQTMISFAYFANILAVRNKARIVSISSSDRNAFLYGLRYWGVRSVYRSFNATSHVNSRTAGQATSERAEREYRRITALLKDKRDIFGIEVDGCLIGCDIYEAYLYEHFRPTVDLSDGSFQKFLLECLHFLFDWRDYLDNHDVRAVILSHGLYKYGILKRLCIRKGIPVYLPNARSMVCIRHPEELGNPEFDSYRHIYGSLSAEARESGKRWAKTQLERRMSGEVGVDMQYSTKSAYVRPQGSSRALADTPRLKVLIATHCFFDNPHAYGVNLFPDFYEWLVFLGGISEQTGYDWYLKTHPDVLPGNEEILAGILARYPRIKKLPPTVSHHQLCEEGISVALTTYGTIGHEYPLLGKQVINAGLNPHTAYDFNYQPGSLEEYRSLLMNLDKLDKKIDLDELYEFYFIHYKFNIAERLFFASYSEFSAKLTVEEQNGPEAYRYFLAEFRESRHRELLAKINAFLDSGAYRYYEPQPVSAVDATAA